MVGGEILQNATYPKTHTAKPHTCCRMSCHEYNVLDELVYGMMVSQQHQACAYKYKKKKKNYVFFLYICDNIINHSWMYALRCELCECGVLLFLPSPLANFLVIASSLAALLAMKTCFQMPSYKRILKIFNTMYVSLWLYRY